MSRRNFFLTFILLSFSFFPFFIEEEILFTPKYVSQKMEEKIVPKAKETILFPPANKKSEIILEQKEKEEIDKFLDVPFVVQAPFGEWSEPRFQNGCEEASILMAMLWVEAKTLAQEEIKKQLFEISIFGEKKFGFFEDTSAFDTIILMKDFFDYENVEFQSDVTVQKIKDELQKGNLVLVPAQGQRLKNPYYTPPGPERHMLLIRGYDNTTKEFITNDPGTRHGQAYRYSYDILFRAILDYPSGKHEPILEEKKAMIIVKK